MPFFATGAVACLGLLAFAAKPAVIEQMDNWQLLPRPEHLTELYFADYTKLRNFTGSDTAQTVSFVVRNHEHRTVAYRYELTAMSEDEMVEYPVDGGSFALNDDHSVTTNRVVALPNLQGRVSVKVSLKYKSVSSGNRKLSAQTQSIRYWTDVSCIPLGVEGKREVA